MEIPKDIADRAREYIAHKAMADAAFDAVKDWFMENSVSCSNTDDVIIQDIVVARFPEGEAQSGIVEYKHRNKYGPAEDDVETTYYHKVEEEDSYVGLKYIQY